VITALSEVVYSNLARFCGGLPSSFRASTIATLTPTVDSFRSWNISLTIASASSSVNTSRSYTV